MYLEGTHLIRAGVEKTLNHIASHMLSLKLALLKMRMMSVEMLLSCEDPNTASERDTLLRSKSCMEDKIPSEKEREGVSGM